MAPRCLAGELDRVHAKWVNRAVAAPFVRPVVLATGLWALMMVAPAGAGTLSIEPNPVTGGKLAVFVAGDGEVNGIYPGIGLDYVMIQDGIGGHIITPTSPCLSGQPGAPAPSQPTNFGYCPKSGVDHIVANLRDEDDSFGGMIYNLPVIVFGGAGGDNITGGSLDDLLFGEDGPDILTGGPGDDLLDGGGGPDRITGDYTGSTGAGGFDLADYSDRAAAVYVTLNGRTDDGEAGEFDNVAQDVEDIAGGAGDDVIMGNERVNILDGGPGADTLDGGAGPDQLIGGSGDDTIRARDGVADTVRCDAGVDTVVADAEDTLASDCELVQSPVIAAASPTPTPTPSPTPAAGQAAITAPVVDRTSPTLALKVPKRVSIASLKRGVRLTVTCSEACLLTADLRVTPAVARVLRLKTTILGRGTGARLSAGDVAITVSLTAKAAKAVRRLRPNQLTARIIATDAAGNAATAAAKINGRPR